MFRSRAVHVFITLATALSLWGAAWAQTRTEFFSRDLSFSFKDTDRFSVAAGDSTPLLHLIGPESFELTVSKKTSSLKSLSELAETFPATLPQGPRVLSNRMTTVGSQLATAFEIGDSPERVSFPTQDSDRRYLEHRSRSDSPRPDRMEGSRAGRRTQARVSLHRQKLHHLHRG